MYQNAINLMHRCTSRVRRYNAKVVLSCDKDALAYLDIAFTSCIYLTNIISGTDEETNILLIGLAPRDCCDSLDCLPNTVTTETHNVII